MNRYNTKRSGSNNKPSLKKKPNLKKKISLKKKLSSKKIIEQLKKTKKKIIKLQIQIKSLKK